MMDENERTPRSLATMTAAISVKALRGDIEALREIIADGAPGSYAYRGDKVGEAASGHIDTLLSVIDAQASEIAALERELDRREGAAEVPAALSGRRERELVDALASAVKTIGEMALVIARVGRA